jgi:hypothetical protein
MDQNISDRIRERAYEIWVASGSPYGQAERHWFAAELELLSASGVVQPVESVEPPKNKRRAAPKRAQRA